MLESLKSAWQRWKVQVSFVGGALVVATAYGTCSYDPQQVSEEPSEAAATEEVSTETTEVTAISSTNSETEATETETTTETSTTNTGE